MEKRTAVLQEATSQFPPETLIEDVMVPEDVGYQIMNDVLDQNLGRRSGKVVRCMGKAQIRETGVSSSKYNTIEVDALKEEVTTLKGHLVIQEEQMRAQGEQMRAQMMAQSEQMRAQLRAQGEEIRNPAGTVRELLQAIQMSGLQISLPPPHLPPPSTIEPPCPANTQ